MKKQPFRDSEGRTAADRQIKESKAKYQKTRDKEVKAQETKTKAFKNDRFLGDKRQDDLNDLTSKRQLHAIGRKAFRKARKAGDFKAALALVKDGHANGIDLSSNINNRQKSFANIGQERVFQAKENEKNRKRVDGDAEVVKPDEDKDETPNPFRSNFIDNMMTKNFDQLTGTEESAPAYTDTNSEGLDEQVDPSRSFNNDDYINKGDAGYKEVAGGTTSVFNFGDKSSVVNPFEQPVSKLVASMQRPNDVRTGVSPMVPSINDLKNKKNKGFQSSFNPGFRPTQMG